MLRPIQLRMSAMFIAPESPIRFPAAEERNAPDINQLAAVHSAPTELRKYFVLEDL